MKSLYKQHFSFFCKDLLKSYIFLAIIYVYEHLIGRIVEDSIFYVGKEEFMNQIPMMQPIYPVQGANYALPQQPSYNAVKIDIHNPSVGAPGMAPMQPQYQPQYAPVNAPIYNYPQYPVYCPQPQVPAETTATAPVYYPGQPLPQNPVQYPAQPMPQAPVQPAVNQQNINYPTAAPQPVPAEVPAQVPAPQVSNAPVIETPKPVEPSLDLNGFISRLANPDFEGQAAAMEDIADVVNKQPEKASELVDKQIFKALDDIIAFDSSKVEGPSQKQIEIRQKLLQGEKVSDEDKALADTLSPKEKAEMNKSYALYSIALLDKIYAQEIKKLSNNTVPLTDLPNAVNVVNQLKDNPNPMVRESAIEALSYIQDQVKEPEYKKDLTTLFTVAKNDQDASVASAAQAALDKLGKAA